MDHRPTLDELVEIVVTSVAYKWEDIAIYLDVSTDVTDNIKASDRNTNEDHCREMLKQWLRTTDDMMGKMPRTWASIFQAIDKSIGFVVANDVKRKLFPEITPEGKCNG